VSQDIPQPMLGRLPIRNSGVTYYVKGLEFIGGAIDTMCSGNTTMDYAVIALNAVFSGVKSFGMSGAISGRVLTSDLSGAGTWQPAPPASVSDPLDVSGAMIDVLSGVTATFNSGVRLVDVSGTQATFSGISVSTLSGNVADLSGVTIDIVSGVRGSFNSGIISVAISGLLGFQMSGALSGRVVTSDSAGVGTWQTPPTGGGGSSPPGVAIGCSVYLSKTMTNIGTAYKQIFAAAFDPDRMNTLHTSGYTQFKIRFIWDYIGKGSQQIRWVDSGTVTNILWESPTFTIDQDPGDSGWVTISGNFVGVEKLIMQQGKSTIAADDPVPKGYTIFLR